MENNNKNNTLQDIHVNKRNGKFEPLNLEKIHKVVGFACDGITGVSVSDIEMKAHLNFINGISTKQITEALIKSSADLISETSPNYQYVAANLLNYDLRKDVWGTQEPVRLYDHINKMVKLGYYTEDLLTNYSEKDWDVLDSYIDHDRDFNFAFVGLREYIDKYAVRDRSLNTVSPLETPQLTYMLISALSRLDTKNLKEIKSLYNDISLWNISLPTPIMAGLRTAEKQMASCCLIAVDDDLDSISAGATAIMKYVSNKAGIGIDGSRIRAAGSKVGKTGKYHTGVTPFFRVFESATKSCSQGSIRNGSTTLTACIWHKEISDILVLKNNKGTQDNRVRKIDYSIQINDYFYDRFVKNKDVTLFSPNEVPGLYDAFFKDQVKFAELYEKYEKDQSISKKSISARELFSQLMIERKETGRIYIFNVDNVNNYKPYLEAVTTSNLCQEVLIPTVPLKNINDSEGEIALCILSAINLGNVKNFDDLESICRNAVRTLDNLIDYQDYIVPAAHTSTMKYRPLGIGVINLAYYLAKNGVNYGSKEGWQLIDDTMEALNYYYIKASIELAKERGPCLGYEKTKWSQGKLPIDYYKKTIDEIIPFSPKQDWEWLRTQLKLYGIRNSVLSNFMPADSSAKISNATSGVDPVRSLITTKKNKSNITKQVVPEFNRLKNKYDMLWDMKSMDGMIKSMAVINRLCSQSISSNLSYNPAHYENNEIPLSIMLKDLLKANYFGLPTLYYHNTRDGREDDVVEDKPLEKNEHVDADNEVCDSCTI